MPPVTTRLCKRFNLEPVVMETGSCVISTGVPALDAVLGGGIPGGCVTEVFGPAGVGKSTLALTVMAQAQQAGLPAVLVAGERPLPSSRLVQLGVDLDGLVAYEPPTLETALEVVRELMADGVGLVVVDSVAAFPLRAEVQGEIGDCIAGRIPQIWDQGYRCIDRALQDGGGALLLVNQIREEVGVMFASPERTVGQEVIAYWASVRLDLRKQMALKAGGHVVGQRVRVRVVKSKVGMPYRVVEFDLRYDGGVMDAGNAWRDHED